MTPLVSVIIPAYNAERYIGRALCSSLEQTYRNLEIVVVDDGSTDGTARIVQEIRDPRIVYIQQANAGQGNARNRGIRECRGDYIGFLDADDLYMPGKVQRQLEFLLEHTRYKIVYCNALHMYSDKPGVYYKRRGKFHGGHLLPELLRSSYINPNTVLMAREVLEICGGFVETRYYPEEWDLWLRISLAGYEFGYLDEDLVVVEIRDSSNTTMKIQPILKKNAIMMFETLLPRPVEVEGVVCAKDPAVRSLQLKLAVAYLANGRRRESLTALTQALGRRSLTYLVGGALMIMPRAFVRRLWLANQRRNSMVVRQA